MLESTLKAKEMTLYQYQFSTPLGHVVAIADLNDLYLLEFTDRKNLTFNINKLAAFCHAKIIEQKISVHLDIQTELESYFLGQLSAFNTSVKLFGTKFQCDVWQQLQKIPLGKTVSYKNVACKMKKPQAHRAIARANSMNRLAIIVPCHRVIYANGDIGGYAGGIHRKEALLHLESGIAL